MTAIPPHLVPAHSTNSMASVSSQALGGAGGLDEASSASHASSSRFGGQSMSTSGTGVQARVQYQPISMAEALARAGQDQVRALDQLVAERNKLCLEASKLSTENMRLWNVMRRIRRENEELKGNTSARNSPMSNASTHSGQPIPSASLGVGQAGQMHGTSPSANGPVSGTLSTSSTAPTLTYPSKAPSSSEHGNGPYHTNISAAGSINAPSSPYESGPSAGGHSSMLEEKVEPRGSLSASDPQGHSSASSAFHQATTALSESSSSATAGGTQGAVLGIEGSSTGHEPTSAHSETELLQAHQHASIMQQRAAVQAQRLAQLQQRDQIERPPSVGSHEFDAVDGSSIAASEDVRDGRSSARASGEINNSKRGSGLPSRHVPPSPLILSSPTQTERSRPWSVESPRNSFSPRLEASLLPYLSLSIAGSNLRSSERGKEIVSFFIAVDVKPPAGKALQYSAWRVEKTYSDVLALDARLKQKHGKNVAKRMAGVQLPDQTLFKDHAPSKVDRRKAMLELYLKALLSIPLPDKDDLCTFFCTDAMPPKIPDLDALTKEGFLTKKGQNLGRWVTRWYVLTRTSLDHYESRGGVHLGSINIRGAQIGRQQKSAATDTDENSYRHAFLILETKPAPSPGETRQVIRHVLCAESDDERDDWVDVLVRAIGEADNRDRTSEELDANPYVAPTMPSALSQAAFTTLTESDGAGMQPKEKRTSSDSTTEQLNTSVPLSPTFAVPTSQQRPNEPQALTAPNSMASPDSGFPRSKSEVTGVQSHEDRGARFAALPGRHAGLTSTGGGSTLSQGAQQPPLARFVPSSPARPPPRSTSQEVGGSSSSTGHGVSHEGALYRSPSPGEGTNLDRQSTSSATRASKDRMRPSISAPMNGTPIPSGYKFGGKDENASNISASDTKRRFWHRFGGGSDKSAQPKKVFGVPLTESIAVSNISEGLELPAVVYRCIEYLEHRNAALEEGIYRLSGSSAVIKSLKDRFNVQGDVNLLAPSEPYYDPHAIAGLLKQFLRELPSSVLTRELHLDFMRVNEIADRRERVNELGSLVSMLPLANYSLLRTLCSHLIKVIERSDVNKMTMRNVGIVFSPTLGIPAGVFGLFMTEFDWVFYTDAKGEPAPRTMDEDIIPPDESELGIGAPRYHESAATMLSDSPSLSGQRVNAHQMRNNRNSLSYNEAEADRLLGGPQAHNRLSTYQEDIIDTGDNETGTVDDEVLEGEQVGQEQYDQSSESGLRYQSGFAPPPAILAQPTGLNRAWSPSLGSSGHASTVRSTNEAAPRQAVEMEVTNVMPGSRGGTGPPLSPLRGTFAG